MFVAVFMGLAALLAIAGNRWLQDRQARVDRLLAAADSQWLAGKFTESLGAAQDAVALAEQIRMIDSRRLAASLSLLGSVQGAVDMPKQAERSFLRALETFGSSRETVRDRSKLECNLGDLYSKQGRYAEAEPLLNKALTEQNEGPDADSSEYASCRVTAAEVYRSQRRDFDAESQLNRAIAILSRDPDARWRLGLAHHELGNLYAAQGRYAESGPAYEQALKELEQSLGPNHPFVATVLVGLGRKLAFEHRYEEAQAALERAVAIEENALVPDHPQLVTTRRSLAQLNEERALAESHHAQQFR